MTIDFTWAPTPGAVNLHHAAAAAANTAVVDEALAVLTSAIAGKGVTERLLLRAAAGAGKSYTLVRMVVHALEHGGAERVAVCAFQNRQVQPLARQLGKELGKDQVVLLASKAAEVPDDVVAAASVARRTAEIQGAPRVVLSTSHRFGVFGEQRRIHERLGLQHDSPTFDVLFVDEAWQMSEHLYGKVRGYAPITVAVGDVGQLPPLDPNKNPWRGDPGHNPFRAWPTAFADDKKTWAKDLPTVWRPTAAQLTLWRTFYSDWDELHSVAAPGDRCLEVGQLDGPAAAFWARVGTGRPVLLEVSGLEEPDQPDVDLPLLGVAEQLLDELLEAGFALVQQHYASDGSPQGEVRTTVADFGADPLIAVLATRNQMVDDAKAMAERLVSKHDLDDGVIAVSTVDKYQGQTNGLTLAIHPLSGADRLDEFNSAFGRLAVVCTRATHGLCLLTRDGIDDLLEEAPARPGTPFGEPGPRSLPRQTHARIAAVLDRGRVDARALGLSQ